MSYWDGEKVVTFSPEPAQGYPGWMREDCGCSNGLQWGGEEPRECLSCMGNGSIYRHIKSGALAEYPGGRFVGRS